MCSRLLGHRHSPVGREVGRRPVGWASRHPPFPLEKRGTSETEDMATRKNTRKARTTTKRVARRTVKRTTKRTTAKKARRTSNWFNYSFTKFAKKNKRTARKTGAKKAWNKTRKATRRTTAKKFSYKFSTARRSYRRAA